MDAASAQALAQFIADGIALFAFGGLVWQLRAQRQELTAQREQLNAQREELATQEKSRQEEAERNRKRDELLETQLAEARREAEAARRAQAVRVTVEWDTSSYPPRGIILKPGEVVHAAYVHNVSGRPIRDLRAGIRFDQSQYQYANGYVLWKSADPVITPDEQQFTENVRVDLVPHEYGYMFLFPYSPQGQPGAKLAVRFMDDNDLEWQVNPDLTVSPFKPDEWSN